MSIKTWTEDVQVNTKMAIAVTSLALASVMFPVLLFGIVGLLLLSNSVRRGQVQWGAIALISALMAWINTTRQITGDWTWYVGIYKILSYQELTDVLGTRYGPGGIDIKSSEPVFYAIAWVVGRLPFGGITLLAIVVTILIYGTVGWGTSLVCRQLIPAGIPGAVVIVSTLLIGITFTLTLQVVRQELAAGFLCVGIGYLTTRKNWNSACFFTLACLTHNSAIVPIAIFFLARWAASREAGVNRWVLGAVGSFTLGLIYMSQIAQRAYLTKSDGSIGISLIAFDCVLVASVCVVTRVNRSEEVRTVLAFAVMFASFLIAIYGLPLPFLRMYFYLDVVRAVCVAIIAAKTISWSQRSRLFVVPFLLVVGISYVTFRIAVSPFLYEKGNILQYLFS